MPEEGEKLLPRMLARQRLTPRRAAIIIAAFTVMITVLSGVVGRLVIPRTFTASVKGSGGRFRP